MSHSPTAGLEHFMHWPQVTLRTVLLLMHVLLLKLLLTMRLLLPTLHSGYLKRPASSSEASALFGLDPTSLAQLALAGKQIDGSMLHTRAVSAHTRCSHRCFKGGRLPPSLAHGSCLHGACWPGSRCCCSSCASRGVREPGGMPLCGCMVGCCMLLHRWPLIS